MNNEIIVISGFSGAGKDTIAKAIHKLHGHNFVISHSTRPMRPNESNGDPYYFISDNEMCTMAFNNELIEGRCYNTIDGNWFYAVHKDAIEGNSKYVVVLDILGYQESVKHFGDRVCGIFLDVDEETRRLRASSQRLDFNPKEWERRYKDDMKIFKNYSVISEYNYVIKNIDFNITVNEVSKLIEHFKSQR